MTKYNYISDGCYYCEREIEPDNNDCILHPDYKEEQEIYICMDCNDDMRAARQDEKFEMKYNERY